MYVAHHDHVMSNAGRWDRLDYIEDAIFHMQGTRQFSLHHGDIISFLDELNLVAPFIKALPTQYKESLRRIKHQTGQLLDATAFSDLILQYQNRYGYGSKSFPYLDESDNTVKIYETSSFQAADTVRREISQFLHMHPGFRFDALMDDPYSQAEGRHPRRGNTYIDDPRWPPYNPNEFDE
jgi:hypothetical protein